VVRIAYPTVENRKLWVRCADLSADRIFLRNFFAFCKCVEGAQTLVVGHDHLRTPWLLRPGAPLVFLFVLTYKLGDSAMGPMVKPFWVDRGLSVEEIGLISTTLGVVASIAGALAGGVLTSRWGIVTALWRLGLLQAFSNLGYAAVAGFGLGRPSIYAASLVESFTGGLGTAAFLAFLMRICDKQRAATEYALLSAIFGLTRIIAGGLSGVGTTWFGYAIYFSITFVLAFPALALLPWIRPWADAERD
jgi:PAT family beta-lactamase induction signal transducer AmpG